MSEISVTNYAHVLISRNVAALSLEDAAIHKYALQRQSCNWVSRLASHMIIDPQVELWKCAVVKSCRYWLATFRRLRRSMCPPSKARGALPLRRFSGASEDLQRCT